MQIFKLRIKIIVFIAVIAGMLFSPMVNVSHASATQISCSFTRSLSLGTRGNDVSCLQRYLMSKGFYNYSGGVTGYFGYITRAAVAKWQAANKVYPSVGYFGPLSRTKFQGLIAIEKNEELNKAAPDTLIQLPQVDDSEILIDPSGVTTLSEYIDYFVNNSSKLSFDGKRMATIIKNTDGVFMLPVELAEKAISDGVSDEIKNSFAIYNDFLKAKIEFLKSIKVSGENVAFHKKMIGFDKLTLDIIQKTLDYGNGTYPKNELSDILLRYQSRASIEQNEILKKTGLIASRPSLLERIISFLGLEKEFYALAVNLPFGGTIGTPIFCTCSLGWLIYVSPPKPPVVGALYVPVAFIATPLFYRNKSLKPGAWWLGLHTTAVIPCLEVGTPCYPIGYGNLIFMTGTSI